MDRRDASYLLTDYVQGRLDDQERQDVAAAIEDNPDLQGLLAWLRQVQRLLDMAGERLFGHPDAERLVVVAQQPDQADPDDMAHVVSCPSCRDHVAATRGVDDDLGKNSTRPAVAWSRVIPLTALGMAACLALLVFGIRWGGESTSASGATRALMVAAAVRGEATVEETPFSLSDLEQMALLVAVNPYLEAEDGPPAVQVELLRIDEPIWSWTGAADEVWNPDLGFISLNVPASALAPGPHEILVRVDGRVVLQRTVQLEP